jgi:hypothetical protein
MPRAKAFLWSTARLTQLQRLRAAGVDGIKPLAEAMGISEATLRSGLYRMNGKDLQAERDDILRRYWTRMTPEWMAEKTGLPVDEALARGKAIGLDPSRARKPKPPAPPMVRPSRARHPAPPPQLPKHRFSREQIAAALQDKTPEGALLRAQIMRELGGRQDVQRWLAKGEAA